MYEKFLPKVDEIVSKMTLKEKIGQLNQITVTSYKDNMEELYTLIRNGMVGSIIVASSSTAGNDEQGHVNTDFYDKLQKIAVTESRLGIPMIYGRDVIHGHRTVYPVPLASAASFNDELVEKCYSNIAKEASCDGIHWTFSPMVDMCHDPRWGRIIEGPGEDPVLGGRMAKACIKGFQGENPAEKGKLAACAKHYIGYGASEGGRDYHRTEISDYTLYNKYLPAFKASADAGVLTVMSSFNDISGVPTSGSKKYLTDILRGKVGFEGFVISDWGAVEQLCAQGVAETRKDCARIALNAGLDMDMCDKCYVENLEELVASGEVTEDTIDTSVKRILMVKLACGLFENPYCEKVDFNREDHIADAKELASESMVLLKNDGILPLKKDMNIALVGPFRTERRSLLGSWTLDGKKSETPNLYEAMSEKATKEIHIQLDDINLYDASNYIYVDSDVVVMALGEAWQTTGENRAVSDISLYDEQKNLIHKMHEAGKKVVGVFFCGRPRALADVEHDLDAIIYAWHCGSETAHAVTDILFGDAIPCGKTPVTFPAKSGHIPMYYNVTPSGRPVNCYYGDNSNRCYMDSMAKPLYPFGFGLSYTTFEYSDIIVDKTEITLDELKNGGKITACVNIKNTGNYDGKEIAELYIRDKFSSIMRPIRELKDYKKPFIKKGESQKVNFDITFETLGYYDENGNFFAEKGDFEIYIGEDCLTENKITITVK